MLTSIIFLFIKHPFDVGDRVMIATQTYTVKEIRLLSTVFLDSNNGVVQAPNSQLNTLVRLNKSPVGVLGTHGLFMAYVQFIQNMRRSPQVCATMRSLLPVRVAYYIAFRCLKHSHST